VEQESNREQWRKQVEQWRDSGLSAREYAEKNGVNFYTLRYWSSRFPVDKRKKKIAAAVVVAPGPKFIDVTEALAVPKAAKRGSGLELLVSDVVIRLSVGFDQQTLRQVLAVVRRP
jgi:hypothetical protein